jgi:large subunit ribosomal protein L7/L12
MHIREWSPDVRQIGDTIVNLTLRQAVQLRNYLEEVHDVRATGILPVLVSPKPPNTPVQPEQTEWAVVLEGYDEPRKLQAIKAYREITGKGLKEAKDFIETGAGKPIREGLPLDEAMKLKEQMEQAGVKVSVK